MFQGFWETTLESWTAQIDLILNATFHVMKAGALIMRENGGGLIVNLGSYRDIPEGLHQRVPEEIAAGTRPGVRLAMHGSSVGGAGEAYPTSKVAIFTMSTLVAQVCAADKIVVLTLNPGGTRTENFIRSARLAGLDPRGGVSVETSAKAVGFIARSADSMAYAGRFIEAEPFCRNNGINVPEYGKPL